MLAFTAFSRVGPSTAYRGSAQQRGRERERRGQRGRVLGLESGYVGTATDTKNRGKRQVECSLWGQGSQEVATGAVVVCLSRGLRGGGSQRRTLVSGAAAAAGALESV